MRKRCFPESCRKVDSQTGETYSSWALALGRNLGRGGKFRLEVCSFWATKTRSHFGNFPQKCDRSVCCLTITALDPLNNREQRSTIQSKISNLKSKIGRSHFGNFPQKCDRSVCCLRIRALDPLNKREQRSIIQSNINSGYIGMIKPQRAQRTQRKR
jgi:hypothetical protein